MFWPHLYTQYKLMLVECTNTSRTLTVLYIPYYPKTNKASLVVEKALLCKKMVLLVHMCSFIACVKNCCLVLWHIMYMKTQSQLCTQAQRQYNCDRILHEGWLHKGTH